ncbi:MAG: hypothetical protein AAGE94_03380 [Acidobacteriota bacterium]
MTCAHVLRRAALCCIILSVAACAGGGGGGEDAPAVRGSDEAFPVPTLQTVRFLPTTDGVNYEFLDTDHHPDYISGSDLRMRIAGTLNGRPIEMINDDGRLAASVCSGPCNTRLHAGHSLLNCQLGEAGSVIAEGSSARCGVRVLRFAQAGRVDGPQPFEWLITMPDDGDALSGHIETALDAEGRLAYPAKINLDGRMIITVQPAGSPVPMRLTSRTIPEFRGSVAGWPPHGMKVELTNGPIEYFPIDQIDDPDAEPLFVAETNTVVLGERSNAFFHTRPKVEADVGDDGVALRWTDTAQAVGDVELAGYNIYRNDQPGALKGWTKIATVSASSRRFVDETAGPGVHDYVVSHFTDFPFGYEYEGLYDHPARVEISP